MIVATVIFHVAGLIGLSFLLQDLGRRVNSYSAVVRATAILTTTVLTVLMIHIIEAWGWAVLYLYVGEFSGLGRALYFSAVTATTLGYGDITLSEQWQLLSTIEAMGGLILFGASTAFLIAMMRHIFDDLGVSQSRDSS
jgi:voltage-gated potassium channel Kch